jgi:hypothetical protein
MSLSIHGIQDLSQASKTQICLWNSWGEFDIKFGKKLVEDWLGNHYCKEFLLETRIYYMGVVGHDLIGNYQKAHDRCAIWSAFT